MDLGERVAEILTRMRTADIRPRAEGLHVWDIGWPGLLAHGRRERRQRVERCRDELLTAFLKAGSVFMMNEDWQPAGTITWLLPEGFDPAEAEAKYWLFTIGGWTIYRAPAGVEVGWPDEFRCGAAELLTWMRDQSIEALIASFHDDSAWVVAAA